MLRRKLGLPAHQSRQVATDRGHQKKHDHGDHISGLINGEGVERTFQLYSPLIANIEVKRRGDVRRAKLYFLRERSGKSARIKAKLD